MEQLCSIIWFCDYTGASVICELYSQLVCFRTAAEKYREIGMQGPQLICSRIVRQSGLMNDIQDDGVVTASCGADPRKRLSPGDRFINGVASTHKGLSCKHTQCRLILD